MKKIIGILLIGSVVLSACSDDRPQAVQSFNSTWVSYTNALKRAGDTGLSRHVDEACRLANKIVVDAPRIAKQHPEYKTAMGDRAEMASKMIAGYCM